MVLKGITCVRCSIRHTFKMSEEQYGALQSRSTDVLSGIMDSTMHKWIPLMVTGQCLKCWNQMDRDFANAQ